MDVVELGTDERPGSSWRFRILASPWERLRGLIGTAQDAQPVLLLRCSSVHTFAMNYALDLAFLSGDGRVVLVRENVPPGRVVSRRDAFCVLERPSSEEPWFRDGECVRVISLTVGDGALGHTNERMEYELR